MAGRQGDPLSGNQEQSFKKYGQTGGSVFDYYLLQLHHLCFLLSLHPGFAIRVELPLFFLLLQWHGR